MAGGKAKKLKSGGQLDAEIAIRWETRRQTFQTVKLLGGLVAAAVPLTVIRWTIEPFAGVDTSVDLNIALTFVLSASVVLNGLQGLKMWSQRRAIKRLRVRSDESEARLGMEFA